MIVKNLKIKAEDTIIENVSLSLEKGLIVIYGESGSGKTALMVSLAGLNEFFGIEKEGVVVADCSVMFEDTDNQIIGYTVADEIEIAGIDKKYLRVFGLDGYESREVHTLSGGELKKLCIAEALSKGKDIILDDPQSHLDSESLDELWRILSDISHEKVVIVLTRRPDLFACDEIYVLTRNGLKKARNIFEFRKVNVKRGSDVAVRGEGITFSYGSNVIFEDLTFEFKEGVSVVTGRNGSGKTTLLKIIAGLLKCGGKLRYFVKGSRIVSYVHQFPEKAFFYTYAWEEARAAIGERYEDVLDVFNISPNKKIDDMNRREKALLAIACSTSAEIVCLDEPTASLDIKGVEILLNALEEISKNFIIATNDRTFLRCVDATLYKLEGGLLERCD